MNFLEEALSLPDSSRFGAEPVAGSLSTLSAAEYKLLGIVVGAVTLNAGIIYALGGRWLMLLAPGLALGEAAILLPASAWP